MSLEENSPRKRSGAELSGENAHRLLMDILAKVGLVALSLVAIVAFVGAFAGWL